MQKNNMQQKTKKSTVTKTTSKVSDGKKAKVSADDKTDKVQTKSNVTNLKQIKRTVDKNKKISNA